jgi:sulfate permease, SulP family
MVCLLPFDGQLIVLMTFFFSFFSFLELLSQVHPGHTHEQEPYPTLIKCFSSFDDFSVDKLQPLIPYLKRMSAPTGTVLWKQGDPPDGLYLIEAGVLRATYKFTSYVEPRHPVVVSGLDSAVDVVGGVNGSVNGRVNSNSTLTSTSFDSNSNSNSTSTAIQLITEDGIFHSGIEESMVPGTLAGELTALSGLPRNATVVVEREAVLWKLTSEGLKELEERESKVAREFTRLVLKGEFWFPFFFFWELGCVVCGVFC